MYVLLPCFFKLQCDVTRPHSSARAAINEGCVDFLLMLGSAVAHCHAFCPFLCFPHDKYLLLHGPGDPCSGLSPTGALPLIAMPGKGTFS